MRRVAACAISARSWASCTDDDATLFFDKFFAGGDGASGRQNVIDEKNFLSRLDSTGSHFDSISAIFQFVFDRDRFTRKFSRFADRDETNVESLRHWQSKKKSS